jgi:competence protein ComEA
MAVIDLNSATAEELETLPEIGPVLAQRIVEYRQVNGPFARTDQLMAVSGIGPATYERVRLLVSAGR